MKINLFLTLCLLAVSSFTPFPSPAFAQAAPGSVSGAGAALEEGIRQYQRENYEEAIAVLGKVRAGEPKSSQAAFFLGMAYKQTMDYPKAAANLQDAVTLSPPVKEALVELIDTLYQLGRLEEAHKWLALAEKENISPARTAFLKGLILSKENRNPEAIKAFEKAKALDPKLVQPAEFQIGVSHIKDRNLDQARAILQTAISRDPRSDLAGFARQYESLVEEQLYRERPLRLTATVLGGYDTNIVSKPLDAFVAADITDEKGAYLSSSARLDYIPRLKGPWIFHAQYGATSTVFSKHTHSHDSLANSLSMAPGYNFGRFSLGLNASYTNVLLRTDPALVPAPDSSPGYKHYLDYASLGPIVRLFISPTSMLEVFAGYDLKNYYNQKIPSPDTIRDAEGFREYLSWIWLFREDSFLNLRYDFATEHADGNQWSNNNHRLTASVSIPVLPAEKAKRFGPLNLQVAGSAFVQNFVHEVNYGIVTTTRRDKVYTGSAGLAWKFSKYASLITQYTKTRNDSNVPIFEYDRDQYAAGVEFRY